jgi:hypothetical protein
MNAGRQRASAEQLTLPFPTTEPAERLAATSDALVALNRALRFLLDVADRNANPGPATASQLQESLDTLAPFNLGGRLGHVVRRFRAQPPTNQDWAELASELAFAVNLCKGEPTP